VEKKDKIVLRIPDRRKEVRPCKEEKKGLWRQRPQKKLRSPYRETPE